MLWAISGIALAACSEGKKGVGGGDPGITTGYLLDASGSNGDDRRDDRYFAIRTPGGHQVSSSGDLQNLVYFSSQTSGPIVVMTIGTNFSVNGKETVGFCSGGLSGLFSCGSTPTNGAQFSYPLSGSGTYQLYVDVPDNGHAELKLLTASSTISSYYYLGRITVHSNETGSFDPNDTEQQSRRRGRFEEEGSYLADDDADSDDDTDSGVGITIADTVTTDGNGRQVLAVEMSPFTLFVNGMAEFIFDELPVEALESGTYRIEVEIEEDSPPRILITNADTPTDDSRIALGTLTIDTDTPDNSKFVPNVVPQESDFATEESIVVDMPLDYTGAEDDIAAPSHEFA